MTNSKISSRSSDKGRRSDRDRGERFPFSEEHEGVNQNGVPKESNLRETDRHAESERRASPGTRSDPADLPKPAKHAASEKDFLLKLETAQALCAAGYFVRTNVALSEVAYDPRGGHKLTDITDVDVFATAYAMDFVPDTVCVSCKAGSSKGLSPIKETLMMAGVMQYLRAKRGYAVFSERRIDSHMYGLAQQLSIALLSLDEWKLWKSRQVGSRPIPAHFQTDVYVAIKDLSFKRNDLAGLIGYTRGEYWYYRDFRNIQNLIGIARKYAKSFPSTSLGRFAFLDLLCIFALSVLQLCEYVTFSGASRLNETIPPYLFGGQSVYKSRRELLRRVEEMLRARDVLDKDQRLPSLDPSYTTELAELVARYVQKPIDAVRVPQYLNFLAGITAAETVGLGVEKDSGESSTTQKFALDLANVVAMGASVDKDILRLF